MKVIAIVQARTGSTRLPGKTLLKLGEESLIWHIFKRLSYCKFVQKTVLATTTNVDDDKLVDWAKSEGVEVYRGSETNVLSRFYEAACTFNADVIVRITGDDPFKDPEVVDRVINEFFSENLDFAFNNYPPSYPEGLDVEVFSFKSLKCAFENSEDQFEFEHVTQFFYRNMNLFKTKNIPYHVDLSNLRWTIDEEVDYQMALMVYEELYKKDEIFLMKDILDLLSKKPEISEINFKVSRSLMYNKISK